MKKYLSIALILLALIVAALAISGRKAPSEDAGYRHAIVTLAGKAFDALVSDTDALREKGLSYRNGLPEGQVMLFIFDKPDLVGFWMKDMRFSIDMLWLADDGTAVSLQESVSPDTYPRVFLPAKPSRYVIELSAGTLAALGLKVGDKVAMSGGK